jgi:hypothetical protein
VGEARLDALIGLAWLVGLVEHAGNGNKVNRK